MQVTVDRVSGPGTGLLVNGEWINRSRDSKANLKSIQPGTKVELEGVSEYNGKTYFKSFKILAGGSASRNGSSFGGSTAKGEFRSREEIIRCSALDAAVQVFAGSVVSQPDLANDPLSYVRELAGLFEGYITGNEEHADDDDEEDFPE